MPAQTRAFALLFSTSYKNWRFFRSKQQQMLLRYFRCKYKKRFRYIQQVSGNGTIFDIFISVCLIRRRLPASPHGPRPAPVHSGQTPAVHARLPFPAACIGASASRCPTHGERPIPCEGRTRENGSSDRTPPLLGKPHNRKKSPKSRCAKKRGCLTCFRQPPGKPPRKNPDCIVIWQITTN